MREGLSLSRPTPELGFGSQDIAVCISSSWSAGPNRKATVSRQTPSTESATCAFPRANTSAFPLTPRSLPSLGLDLVPTTPFHAAVRHASVHAACCMLAGGRSPSRAVWLEIPRKNGPPLNPVGPVRSWDLALGQRSIVMSAQPPVLYEKGPVAMTMCASVSYVGRCWHYPTGMNPHLVVMRVQGLIKSVLLAMFSI